MAAGIYLLFHKILEIEMTTLSNMAASCANSQSDIKAIESKLSDDIDLYYTDWRENVMERGGEEFSPSFGQYCKMRRRQDSP
jgi:hypothetical protein